MSIRLKTIEYWIPHLTTAADNTDTNLTQITVYIPETIDSFRKVYLEMVFHDANTTLTGTCARRQVSLQLGASGYSAVNSTTTQTLSGENWVGATSGDFTSYFTTYWSGTSMTCDTRFLYDMSTATPLGARNISAKLVITYSYDDTSSTHIKTVRIPLNAPVGTVATAKPGSAVATIPDLSSGSGFLPEASITIRQVATVVQGNTHGTSTDITLSWQIDTSTDTLVSQSYEHGGNQSMWFRLSNVNTFTTTTSHSWYLWGSAANWNHLQAWLVVTYEFDPSTTSTVLNSLILPMEFDSPMGGPTSSDYQRATRELWIEEPTTITLKTSAFYAFWDQAASIVTLYARIGTGSFITYNDNVGVATNSGGNGCMIIDPGSSAITLARGRNTLQADFYNSDNSDLGFNLSGFWMLNYTSGKASDGVGAHNHTVFRNMKCYNTGGITLQTIIAADAPDIPESTFFLTAVGVHYSYISNSTGNAAGCSIGAERLAAGEAGLKWENAYSDVGHTDAEAGIRQVYAQCRKVFNRFYGDADSSRIAFQTARRWRTSLGGGASSLDHFDIIFTYHTITSTVSGSISGSNGGTVYIYLTRAPDNTKDAGDLLLITSISGDGPYSFTWYDDTEDVQVNAYEDNTYKGISKNATANTDFNIALSSSGGGGESFYGSA